MRLITMSLLSILWTGCTGDKDEDSAAGSDSAGSADDTAGGGTGVDGTLSISFAMSTTLIEQLAALSPPENPAGTFYGGVWYPEDIDPVMGPIDDAEPIEEVIVADIDLSSGSTAALYTTGPVPDISVLVLGFLDTDGNADPNDPWIDTMDPVTLPDDNTVQVIADTETAVTVTFGLLYPL